ncbi:MAG: VWA domain-containing protein, partial [Planctomycetota bacterium]
ELQGRGRVRVMTFSDRLQMREALGLVRESDVETPGEKAVARAQPIPPVVPEGAGTNLTKAIRESLKALAGQPVAALVMVTDGQNTSGGDPLAAADFARSQDTAILAIGVGDPRAPQNLRVAEAWAPETVFRGDPFLIQARLQAEGIEGTSVEVQLAQRRADDPGGDETVLKTKNVLIGGGKDTADVQFKHEPTTDGEYIYVVRVPAQPRELLDSDNAKSVTVKVISEQARVLLVAGSPVWDFRMVRTLLIRDKTINVSCWLQSLDTDMRQDGDTVIERYPSKPEDLFQYDVIIFFDPDPMEFDQERVALLEKFVGSHAGGIFWVSGPKFSTRFLSYYRTRDMASLLPVRLGDLARADVRLLVHTASREWALRVTPDGTDHPLMALDKDPHVNRRLWEAMPGVYWSFPATEAKPGAQVLLEHTDPRLRTSDGPRPLLVAGQYGAGRTLYLGFQGTWRWRKLGERYFDRFWVQAVRHLVEGRLVGGKRRGRITTDRDVYPVGRRVAISAKLYDAAFEPLAEPTVPVVITAASGGAPVEALLKAVPDRPGRYEGSALGTQLGVNELEITLPGTRGGRPIRVSKQITVEMPRVEFADPRMARALLTELAERSGGRYFDLADAAGVPDAVPDRRETIVVRQKPRKLWDTTRLLVLLAFLLTVEWAVRKRYRLL